MVGFNLMMNVTKGVVTEITGEEQEWEELLTKIQMMNRQCKVLPNFDWWFDEDECPECGESRTILNVQWESAEYDIDDLDFEKACELRKTTKYYSDFVDIVRDKERC